MIVNTNISALNAWRNLESQNSTLSDATAKLSSGKRINKAADDAAGLAISNKMTAQIEGLDQATSNAQDGISMVQTAEGALNETTAMIQRMRQLAVQSKNDTNTGSDRNQIQQEVNQLNAEIQRIATQTQFNTKNLLTGSASNLTFQIGANKGQVTTLAIGTMTVSALFGGSANVSLGAGAASVAGGISKAISTLDGALSKVSTLRAKLGAVQNRLEHTINNLEVSSQNLQSANSNIEDVDMAKEMATYSKTQVLVQSGVAMLAQANQQPQQVLKLLQ
ncbi:flagellin [Lucifera butyrica]|uniref:Flagellin n=1 Tax=Lucifera butyrica TaxID=1351585 RepID=A0A498RF52_9FIRM|nr:flagellin [Lucifera butyrica]VBB09440.1 flagellin [Lucifera butyrica]